MPTDVTHAVRHTDIYIYIYIYIYIERERERERERFSVVCLTIQVSCRKPLKNFGVCGKDGPTSPEAEQLLTPVFIGVRVFNKTPKHFPCTITKYAIT